MKLKSWVLGLSFLASCLVICNGARAGGTICVDITNPASPNLITSLQHWANAGTGTTTINVAAGTYGISGNFTQLSSGSLVLLGGFKPGTACDPTQRNVGTQTTIFDGGGGILKLEPGEPLTIDGLTLRNYTGSQEIGGFDVRGVEISTVTNAANALLSQIFAQNNSTVYLHNSNSDTNGSITVENCVVHGQPGTTPAGIAALHISTAGNNAYVINCTVADNAIEGLELETYDSGELFVYNTISYGNGGDYADIVTGNVNNPPSVSYSMFSHFPLSPPANIVGSNNISLSDPCCTAPGFAVEGSDYHLVNSSPAINVGTPSPVPAILPMEDIAGNVRWVGSAPDMGAYESLVNNSHLITVTNTSDSASKAGSLRWAMSSAPPNSLITFDLGNTCPNAIVLGSPLPDVTAGQLIINATSQPGWTANDDTTAFDATICVFVVANTSVPYALHVPSSAAANTNLVVRGLGLAGFNSAAIQLEGGSNHIIAGNEFTSLVDDLALLGVGQNHDGIYLTGSAATATIGSSSDPSQINLISDSSGAGVHIDGTVGAIKEVVAGNLIGVAPDGITASGNGTGIEIDSSNGNVVENNIVDNNTAAGITISGLSAFQNVVQNNIIGENANDAAAGNLGPGVLIENSANHNVIGAFPGGYYGSNFINYNGAQGVFISNGSAGNLVLANNIAYNGGLAVDLGVAGATANQNPQVANTSQPNELQNYPIINNAFRTAATEWVQGTLTTFANQTVQIDVYAVLNCVSPGSRSSRGGGGQHEVLATVTTNASGVANFWIKFDSLGPMGYPFPYTISATATSTTGHDDTSEIGNCATESNDMIFRDDFEG